MVITCLKGSYARAGNLCNVFIREIVEVLHIKDEALFIREFEQCLLKGQLYFIARDVWSVAELIHKLSFKVVNR